VAPLTQRTAAQLRGTDSQAPLSSSRISFYKLQIPEKGERNKKRDQKLCHGKSKRLSDTGKRFPKGFRCLNTQVGAEVCRDIRKLLLISPFAHSVGSSACCQPGVVKTPCTAPQLAGCRDASAARNAVWKRDGAQLRQLRVRAPGPDQQARPRQQPGDPQARAGGVLRDGTELRALPFVVSERVAGSQNHRTVGVGRDLCGSSSPTPCRSRVTYSRQTTVVKAGPAGTPEGGGQAGEDTLVAGEDTFAHTGFKDRSPVLAGLFLPLQWQAGRDRP